MQHISTLEKSRDKARDVYRVGVKVTVRPGIGGFTLPDGNYIDGGKDGGTKVVKVYEDSVQYVLEQVETAPESIKAAQRAFDLEIADRVRLMSGSDRSAKAMLEAIQAGNLNDDETAALANIRARTGSSMEAHFHKLEGRGILPLLAAEEVPDSREIEPQRAREVRSAEILADAITARAKAKK